jgi:ABC-type nitrate/sulfonate/bicarbonate transport system permease component
MAIGIEVEQARRARPRALNRLRKASRGLVAIATFLALWQIASLSFGVPILFPGVGTATLTFSDLVLDGSLWADASASLARIGLGFLLGGVIGLLLGLLCNVSRLLAALISPYIDFLRFISGVAWISIFIVWFGIGEFSKIALIAYTVAFTVALAAYTGLAEARLNQLRTAAMFGATPSQVFILIRIPVLIRSVLIGMRLALVNAFLVIVAAEMVQADSGLGFAIISARNFLATDIIFVVMLVIGLLGLMADRLFVLATRTALRRYA